MSPRRLTRRCRSRPIAAIGAALVAIVALGTAAAAQPPASTAMAIPGMTGRFALETPAGNTVTQASFPGKWLLVHFGYTQCPDACPTALNAIAGAIRDLGPLADQLQPLFITLDPQRDTPQVMADFVKSFDSGMIGLRGSAAETAAAANAFRGGGARVRLSLIISSAANLPVGPAILIMLSATAAAETATKTRMGKAEASEPRMEEARVTKVEASEAWTKRAAAEPAVPASAKSDGNSDRPSPAP